MIDQNENIIISGTSSDVNVMFMEDIITLKYDSSGTLLWENIFNGAANNEDVAKSVTLDSMGNVYVCGYTYTSANLEAMDYLTLKINGNTGLTELNALFDGIVGFMDQANAIVTDNTGNIYVTGSSMINTDPFDAKFEFVTIKYSPENVGTAKINHNYEIRVYPNPASDYIIMNSVKGNSVEIMNQTGQIINRIYFNTEKLNLDVSEYQPGIYFYSLIGKSGEKLTSGKFVVTK
jgi:hypothetical protein